MGLADSVIGKIFFIHHRSHLLERNQTAIEVSDDPKVWLETDNYTLTVKEKKILLSDTEWINDNIMDVSQKLICKALERLESHQSVLNWQKMGTPFLNICEEHIQLTHNAVNDWVSSFSSNDRVQIRDCLYTNLSPVIEKFLIAFYKSKTEKNQKYQLPYYLCRSRAMVTTLDCFQLRLQLMY